MRPDLSIIADLIKPEARVLDLGCGDGELLAHLQQTKAVNGYGLEIDADKIASCIGRGINVLEQNLDDGLTRFDDASFDMVVMTETLQAVKSPHRLLSEMLRIGNECIVTFPNFGHWGCRMELALRGVMPVAKQLPYPWYDTPNIRLCTFKDFEALCHELELRVIERFVTDASYRNRALLTRLPNTFGVIAFYRLGLS
ncbi:MAG: methionine biosynthesis protein MetW [Pseudomonadota bacterium]